MKLLKEAGQLFMATIATVVFILLVIRWTHGRESTYYHHVHLIIGGFHKLPGNSSKQYVRRNQGCCTKNSA